VSFEASHQRQATITGVDLVVIDLPDPATSVDSRVELAQTDWIHHHAGSHYELTEKENAHRCRLDTLRRNGCCPVMESILARRDTIEALCANHRRQSRGSRRGQCGVSVLAERNGPDGGHDLTRILLRQESIL
jgi:hypothetical protein